MISLEHQGCAFALSRKLELVASRSKSRVRAEREKMKTQERMVLVVSDGRVLLGSQCDPVISSLSRLGRGLGSS